MERYKGRDEEERPKGKGSWIIEDENGINKLELSRERGKENEKLARFFYIKFLFTFAITALVYPMESTYTESLSLSRIYPVTFSRIDEAVLLITFIGNERANSRTSMWSHAKVETALENGEMYDCLGIHTTL